MLSTVTDQPPVEGFAEYIWMNEEGDLRSKTRLIQVFFDEDGNFLPRFPRWHHNEQLLTVCHYTIDPLRREPSFLALCEQRNRKDQVTSTRADLRRLLSRGAHRHPLRLGFRQGYSLVGPLPPSLRESLDEDLLELLADANLCYHSSGQGWFQVQLNEDVPQEILTVCDHLVLARYLVERSSKKTSGMDIWWEALTLLVGAREEDLENLRYTFWTPPHVLNEGLSPFPETETEEADPYLLAYSVLEDVVFGSAQGRERPEST